MRTPPDNRNAPLARGVGSDSAGLIRHPSDNTDTAATQGAANRTTIPLLRAVELDLSTVPEQHRVHLVRWQDEIRARAWRAWVRLFWLDQVYPDEFLEHDAEAFIAIAMAMKEGLVDE